MHIIWEAHLTSVTLTWIFNIQLFIHDWGSHMWFWEKKNGVIWRGIRSLIKPQQIILSATTLEHSTHPFYSDTVGKKMPWCKTAGPFFWWTLHSTINVSFQVLSNVFEWDDLTGDLIIGGYVILRSMVQHRPFEWELGVNLTWRLSCVLQVI